MSPSSTQDETITDVMQKAVVAISGEYEPVLLWNSTRTEYALCYRTPWQGWCYCLRAADKRVQDGGWCAGFESREECVEYATRHLASSEE